MIKNLLIIIIATLLFTGVLSITCNLNKEKTFQKVDENKDQIDKEWDTFIEGLKNSSKKYEYQTKKFILKILKERKLKEQKGEFK